MNKFIIVIIGGFFLLSCSNNIEGGKEKSENNDTLVAVGFSSMGNTTYEALDKTSNPNAKRILASEYRAIRNLERSKPYHVSIYNEYSSIEIGEVDSEGHILSLAITYNYINNIKKELSKFTKLQKLTLGYVDIQNIASLESVAKNLESLNIYREMNKLDYSFSALFSDDWSNLEVLRIRSPGVKEIQFPPGGNLKKIDCFLSPDIELDSSFYANKSLEELTLGGFDLNSLDLSRFPKLKPKE